MILNLKKTDDDKTKAEIVAKYFSGVIIWLFVTGPSHIVSLAYLPLT
jgi:hypothetical protein